MYFNIFSCTDEEKNYVPCKNGNAIVGSINTRDIGMSVINDTPCKIQEVYKVERVERGKSDNENKCYYLNEANTTTLMRIAVCESGKIFQNEITHTNDKFHKEVIR